jgi:hypothetical protein
MRVRESSKRVTNGRIRLRAPLPRWLALAVGSQACALALAPWLAGSLYVGPRPVAPEQVVSGLLWTGDFPLMGSLLVGCVVLLGLLACGWNVAMWRLPIGRVLVPFVALLLWMGLSVVVNGSGWHGLRRWTEWGVAFVLLLVITALVRRGASGWTLLSAMLISATLLSLRACFEYLLNRWIGIANWRVFASFFNPNLLAGYLVMVIPVTMGVLSAISSSPRRLDGSGKGLSGGTVSLLTRAADGCPVVAAERAGVDRLPIWDGGVPDSRRDFSRSGVVLGRSHARVPVALGFGRSCCCLRWSGSACRQPSD